MADRWTTGKRVTAADLNAVIAVSGEKPVVRLVQAVAQSIPDNTNTALTFTTEDIDTEGFHNTSSNTSRVTPAVAGIYRVRAVAVPSARSDFNTLLIQIAKNGSGVAPSERRPFGGTSVNSIQTLQTEAFVSLNGTTDYVEVLLLQDNVANVAINTSIGGATTSTLEVEFVRSL